MLSGEIRVVAVALLAVGAAGVAIQAQRSASSMQTAASKFLASLTPEQRQRATFAFEGAGAVALELHPHREFSAQRPADQGHDRGAARRRLRRPEDRAQCARLPDLHGHHPAGERAARDRTGPGAGAGSRTLSVLDLRHARRQGHVGLARGRAPRVAALHGDRRQGDRQHAVVQRHQSRRSAGRAAEGHAHPGPARGHGARPGDRAGRDAARAPRCCRPRRRTTS